MTLALTQASLAFVWWVGPLAVLTAGAFLQERFRPLGEDPHGDPIPPGHGEPEPVADPLPDVFVCERPEDDWFEQVAADKADADRDRLNAEDDR